jgi:pescadillo protein
MAHGKKKGKLHKKAGSGKDKKERSLRPGKTGYISRPQVTRRLQISLPQFRQLCIYKGIHPVEPNLKRVRKLDKTWYYLKDISFLRRDEIMNWFRDIKIYEKKRIHLKALGKKAELEVLKKRKPKLNMDHFVRERYPSLQDAVNDLDDALSLIYLFSEMQYGITNKIIRRKQLSECIRLKHEWQSYVIESKTLQKVFVSIKGIYYQVSLLGSTVTWLVPHQQRVQVPHNVDVITMSFFVDFYVTMLSFVFYRLYTELGLHYPPKLDNASLGLVEGSKAVKLEKVAAPAIKTEAAPLPTKHTAPLTAAEQERINIVNRKLQHIIAIDEKMSKEETPENKPDLVEVKTEPKDEDGQIPEEFRKVDEEAGEDSQSLYLKDTSRLFHGFKFFINREIPKQEVRFMIRAFGGEDFTEYDSQESDPKITHHVVDRQWDKSRMLAGREYIQPQWIFDSINAGILLPYHEYAPDASLPPHISPFVNDELKGYVPKQREHLNELIEKQKGGMVDKEGDSDKEEDTKVIGEDDEEDDLSNLESLYMKELAAEQEGRSYAAYVEDELGETQMLGEGEAPKKEEESEDEEVTKALKKAQHKKTKKQIEAERLAQDEKDREAMSLDLLNSRNRRIVKSIKKRLDKKKEINEHLMQKRLNVERKKKEQEKSKKRALPETTPDPILSKRKAEEASKANAKKAKK